MITIELTPEQAVAFRTMWEAGMFEIRNGKGIVHFDASGTIQEIECDVKLYKLGRPIPKIAVVLQKTVLQ